MVLIGTGDIMNDPVPSWQEGTGICFSSVTRDVEDRGYRNCMVEPTGGV